MLSLNKVLHLGWDIMIEWMEPEINEQQRRISAVKYFSLALSMALFILYGLVMG